MRLIALYEAPSDTSHKAVTQQHSSPPGLLHAPGCIHAHQAGAEEDHCDRQDEGTNDRIAHRHDLQGGGGSSKAGEAVMAALNAKQQAASSKQQAASSKQQAASSKQQAASSKRAAPLTKMSRNEP